MPSTYLQFRPSQRKRRLCNLAADCLRARPLVRSPVERSLHSQCCSSAVRAGQEFPTGQNGAPPADVLDRHRFDIPLSHLFIIVGHFLQQNHVPHLKTACVRKVLTTWKLLRHQVFGHSLICW